MRSLHASINPPWLDIGWFRTQLLAFLTNTNRGAHISQTLVFPHWLPIKVGIDFKVLLIAFKAQHGLGPQLYYTAMYSLHFKQ